MAVVVIALLMVAGVVIEYLNNSNQVHVNVVYLSIWQNGSSSGYFGQTSRNIGSGFVVVADSVFTKSLTIENNATTLPGSGTQNISISDIEVSPQQFILQFVSPSLPFHLNPRASVTFTITLRSPIQYSGPMTYTLTVS
jgi:hypothetical protein